MAYARRSLVALIGTAALVAVWLLAARVSSDPQSTKSESSATVPNSTRVSSPADAALAREIDRTLNESDSARARWGIFIVSLKDGRTVYSRDGDKFRINGQRTYVFEGGCVTYQFQFNSSEERARLIGEVTLSLSFVTRDAMRHLIRETSHGRADLDTSTKPSS